MPQSQSTEMLSSSPLLQGTSQIHPTAPQPYMIDMSQKMPFPRLSNDSAQWMPMPVSEPRMSSMDLPGVYPFSRPSDGVVMREEGVSAELLRNSYGELPIVNPFAPAHMLPRQSASSDLNWPVFPSQSEGALNPAFDAVEKQRNSILSNEEIKVSAALTGLKREHVQVQEEEKKEGEEKKSCDRLSLMANIALKELNPKEE